MNQIDYFSNGRHGSIKDPEALCEFYRRLTAHPDFKPKLAMKEHEYFPRLRKASLLEIEAGGVFGL